MVLNFDRLHKAGYNDNSGINTSTSQAFLQLKLILYDNVFSLRLEGCGELTTERVVLHLLGELDTLV